MTQIFLRSICASFLATITMCFLFFSAASAQDGYPVIGSATIAGTGKAPIIRVASSNRESWTDVKTTHVELELNVDIRALEGRIRRYIITPGAWLASPESELARFRGHRSSRVREVHKIRASLASLGLNNSQLVTRCNNFLALGPDPGKNQHAKIQIPVKMRVVARRWSDSGGRKTRSFTVWGTAPATLQCAALRPVKPARVTEVYLDAPASIARTCPQNVGLKAWIYSDRPGTFKYRLVNANGSTTPYFTAKTEKRERGARYSRTHSVKFNSSETRKYKVEIQGQRPSSEWIKVRVDCDWRQPPPSAEPFAATDALTIVEGSGERACPHVARLTARVRTNRPGPVKFRIMRSDGWMSPFITEDSRLRDNGRILAIYHRDLHVNKSQDYEYRVVVHGHPIKSSWKRLRVDCVSRSTAPAPAPSNARLKVSNAHLQILESKLPICPTIAIFRATFQTDRPGPVHFRFLRENGEASPLRTAEARRDRDGAYRAYFEEKVPVRKTTKARYRLRVKGQNVVSNWDRLKVKCFVSMNP